jgi:eukaryotic-like serine/threonine-protein kinase
MSSGDKSGPSGATAPGRPTVDTPRVVNATPGSDSMSGLLDTAAVSSDTAAAIADSSKARSSSSSASGSHGSGSHGSGSRGSSDYDNRHEDHQELVGTTLSGRYTITRKVGQGGMGAVYEATHTLIGKRVAVKVLLDKYAKREALVARLEKEARLASSIGHEHIVDITDFGITEDGRNFVVMEFLEGESLAECLQREVRLPERRVLQIGQQAASALSAAHDKGVVHRDIKPENIFLLQRKEKDFVKVVDFGISKSMRATGENEEAQPRLTQTGMVLGTPLYMSPEQARGDDDLDARVDVYALGVIMYEASTGRVPFQGNNYLSVISQVLSSPPISPRQIVPALTEEFDALVMRAMAKDREDRYASCEALLVDLNALLDDPSHSTERARITGPGNPKKVKRRLSKVGIWVGGVGVTLAGLIGVVSLMMKSSPVKQPVAELPIAAASDARLPDPPATPDAAPAAPRTVEYRLTSNPPGARVWEGGRDLGVTPTTYRAMRDKDERIRLIASRDGYNDTEFFLNPALDSPDQPINVTLEKPKKGTERKVFQRPPATKDPTPEKNPAAGGGDLTGNPYR